jgi:RNA polymerase sigma factor (sigma-70 family)
MPSEGTRCRPGGNRASARGGACHADHDRFVRALREHAGLGVVPKSKAKRPESTREALTVGGFLALWAKDPDLAGRVFLTEGKPIADALFRRWRLAIDEAEDAVHDGLLRAYAHDEAALRRADPNVVFAAWLHGLIRNLAREAIRRQVARRGGGPLEGETEARRRAVRRAQRERRAGTLPQVALRALTVKEREAFDLYMDGLSTVQVAERLGIGRESARERIARAWVALARAVAGVVPVKRSTLRELSLAEKKTLSPRARRAHALWGKGSSYAAIARTLGCTESAARGLLQRLRRSLGRTGSGRRR